MKVKYIVIVVIAMIVNSCNSQKSTVDNKHQENENDKRQEAFDELYDEHH